jgi:hypothetical protein
MSTPLADLDDIEKIEYAIDCVKHGTPFPGVIQDFLIEHCLYDLITKPKERYVPVSKKSTKSK